MPKIQQFSTIMNTSTKCAIGFDMVSRGFGFYETITATILMFIGMMMGIGLISNENSGLYGATVVYLVTIVSLSQWTLNQIIST